ncbi:DUF2306 domain-containing protein [Streptomyces sp. MAR4 CNX-425]|uniref:DUF2306 domain-containing protein n=1 Tax=Streptomyces sp. MAR4 CNX-425 TaxID=3406343 RepID=UPI003B504AC4
MTGPGSRPAPGPGTARSRPRSRRVWALPVVAVAAGTALVATYLTSGPGGARSGARDGLHHALLTGHVLTAFVALVLGPPQLVPALRARRRVHRALGRAYLLAGVLPAALTGVPVALLSGRTVTQVGLTVPALGWLVTGWLAYCAARGRDFEAHRRWMMRNYALTFLAVTARAVVPVLLIAGAPFRDDAAGGGAVDDVIPVGQVLGWVVNLAVAEVLIRRRAAGRRRPPRRRRRGARRRGWRPVRDGGT